MKNNWLRQLALRRIILALDFVNDTDALKLMDTFGRYRGLMIQIGHPLYINGGPQLVQKVVSRGFPVFLHMNLIETPDNAVKSAIEMAKLGVSMFTVHAFGGSEMMKSVVIALNAEVANNIKLFPDRPKVIAVTLPTSVDEQILNETLGIGSTTLEMQRQPLVLHLAKNAKEAGCDGVLCAPAETQLIRKAYGRHFMNIAAGIRAQESEKHDHKVTGTAREAIGNSSDFIIVGREITESSEPIEAMENLIAEVIEGLKHEIALDLFRCGCIKFGKFQLKMHKQYSEAPLSPFYIDLRLLRSYPDVQERIACLFAQEITDMKSIPDRIADAPEAATPIVAMICAKTGIPQVTPRKGEKGYGTGARVEGIIEENDKVLVVDDLITTAGTKNEIVQILQDCKSGVKVPRILVLVDREQGGSTQALAPVDAFYKFSELLQLYVNEGLIDESMPLKIAEYQIAAEEFIKLKRAGETQKSVQLPKQEEGNSVEVVPENRKEESIIMNMTAKERLIFAADVEGIEELRKYLGIFRGEIGAVKIGMELLTNAILKNEPVFQTIVAQSDFRIMFDLKFCDIGDTVKGAARAVGNNCAGRILGFTVHAFAGKKAIAEAIQAVRDTFGEGPTAPRVIIITLLTSLDQSDLDDFGITGTPVDVVKRLATLAAKAGSDTFVCSAKETVYLREINPNFMIINPGIRFAPPEGKEVDLKSQKRVTTPTEAIINGADAIVIGTDLRKGDPVANARRAVAEIEQGLRAKGQ